ncbi:MAG: TlpA disulfide reductase family protein [Chitinophagaceae bacterium]
MKAYLLAILFIAYMGKINGQDFKATVINDTTELHEYDNGDKLKVNYRMNGQILTIDEKDKIINLYPRIKREFNIKNTDTGIVGEINFINDYGNLSTDAQERPGKATSDPLNFLANAAGKPFPLFKWIDINGNLFSNDQLKGKTVVLNFWHTSCIPCIAEMPLLNKLVEKYSGDKVVFIGIAPNSKQELTGFLKKKEFRYNQVPGIDGKAFFSPFPGWPVHVVLNGEGIIQLCVLGKQNGIESKLAASITTSLQASSK